MANQKKDRMQEFENKLDEFNSNKPTPTAAIMNPVNETEKQNGVESNELSNMLKDKSKMEDTHTRRTFLVRNDLLERLDQTANYIKNRGFKTEFINYVIKKGLDELDDLK